MQRIVQLHREKAAREAEGGTTAEEKPVKEKPWRRTASKGIQRATKKPASAIPPGDRPKAKIEYISQEKAKLPPDPAELPEKVTLDSVGSLCHLLYIPPP